jgi:hypothetical protein
MQEIESERDIAAGVGLAQCTISALMLQKDASNLT